MSSKLIGFIQKPLKTELTVDTMTALMSFVCNERSNVFVYREYQRVFEVKRRIEGTVVLLYEVILYF